MKFVFPSIFLKSIEKIQISLKSDTNKGYFPRRPMYIYNTFSLNSSENFNVTHKSCRENHNTNFILNNLFPENRVFVR